MGKENRETKKFKSMVLLLLVLAIFIVAGTFFYRVIGKNSKSYEADKNNARKTINILVLGLDIGDPEQKNNEKVKRTDTMMMMKFDPEKKSAVIVSIPRDILVKVNGRNQKINNVLALKGEDALKKQIEDMIDQPIDYTVKVNYEGFKKVMDAIGGIDIDIDQDMKYDDITQNLHIDLKKGKNVHLDGDKCEQYFRWRKNNNGTGLKDGDLGRINNQHKFMQAVLKKCKSPSILLHIPKILEELPKSIETDMKTDEIIGYGLKLMDLKSDNIKMVTLKGRPVDIAKVSYLKYYKSDNREILDMLRGDAPVEVANIKREDLKIRVLNGTNREGLAAYVRKKLKSDGYKNVDIGNASSKYSESEIKLKDEKLKYIVANDTAISKIEVTDKDELNQYDAIIILGSNYKK